MAETRHRTPYPLHAVRCLALHAQGLNTPLGAEPTPTLPAIENIVKQLSCVQIDTLQMVQRSQNLVIWSRLGRYAPADFDRLIYDPAERRLFEGWQHAASIIPLADYHFQMPHQRRLRDHPGEWFGNWLTQPENTGLLEGALERIRQNGAVRTADFEYNGPKRGSWWDWKPAKVALEHLYAFGDLMIAERVNFQRVYDLTERVLPGWVDTTEPTTEERDCYWVEEGVRALGICKPSQAGDYTYRKQAIGRPLMEKLLKEGTFVPLEAFLADGEVHEMIIHRSNLPLLEQAADAALPARRTTFLSPFDSLFWARRRDEQLWGFRQALEAYKPAATRTWGYFCLPILHEDQLVGRFDPKLDRRNGRLHLKALYLEPGMAAEEELVAGVTAAMRDFLAFHEAGELVIERSQPEDFGRKILAAL